MAIFAVLAAVAVTPSWPVWFWYHPAAMLLGYVVLMGNATLVKKIGGLRATKIHGYLMGAASVAAAFGLICLLSTFSMAVAGTGLLDPHIGMMKTSKTASSF
ncbi:EF-hand domain-containing protein [Durusdinium trenchii]|uniref:EF-hand domain-containing protein n=1 Tax=Durusdinium trenchii TaxID=1381693 RepID=A0ABP0L9B6_9DINO